MATLFIFVVYFPSLHPTFVVLCCGSVRNPVDVGLTFDLNMGTEHKTV